MFLLIVICNYNYGRFLDSAIASAVGQSYANKEVIVVDDGSTDDSVEVIQRWNGKVIPILQANGGQLAAYNRGFAAARGDVIIFLDSDDALDQELGKKVIAAFNDPEVVKVHFRLRLVDALGRPYGGAIPRRLSDGDVKHVLRKGLFYDSSPGSGNAYRRETLARVMPLPVLKEDPHAADFFALQGVAQLGLVRAIGPEPLGSYRMHLDQAGKQILFGNARLKETATAQERYTRLQHWLLERLGPECKIPDQFIDFSVQKLVFADMLFGSGSRYASGLVQGSKYFASRLAQGIWRRPTSVGERIALMSWAVVVLALPRDLGRPLARYVCNPASRNGGAWARISVS